jgi:mRNA-degrading endonuclease RelE of RelBE toxin-antitoxin system
LVTIRNVIWTDKFERELRKVRDKELKARARKRIKEVVENPEIGKPLRFELKGERSVRIPPYRLIYAVKGDTLYLLRFEHRKEVYR